LVSSRNSPVNALVSSGDSVVRRLPESHMKSANANGPAFFPSGAVCCAPAGAADTTAAATHANVTI
jgi:hypothetical protein